MPAISAIFCYKEGKFDSVNRFSDTLLDSPLMDR